MYSDSAEGVSKGTDYCISQTMSYADAFLMLGDIGIGFKATIASSASLTMEGLKRVITGYESAQMEKLVFVIPRGHTFNCQYDVNFGPELKLYTLDIDLQAISTASQTEFPEGVFDLVSGE